MASVDVQQEVHSEKALLAPEDAPEIDNAPQANVYYNNPNPPVRICILSMNGVFTVRWVASDGTM